LRRLGAFAQLAINDDGVGFRLNRPPIARKGRRGLGLLDMRERAICVGGALQIKSIRSRGTKVEVRVPLA
jgi:signal transduction histidine kinase